MRNFLNNRPMLINNLSIERIVAIADLRQQQEAVGVKLAAPLKKSTATAGYEMVGSTAVIEVSGFLTQNPDIFSMLFGGTSTETIADSLKTALADPAVKGILLNVDSPGGTVSGTSGLSDLIYNSRGAKPIAALVNLSLSAAYWIASAADRVYMASGTSQAGSIGVVARHVDMSQAEAMNGVKTTQVFAGKHKTATSPYEPLSADGKQTLQGAVDYIYNLFINAVSRNRGMGVETVKKDMADGRIFIGQQAVNSGLADGIKTMDEVLKSLSSKATTTQIPSALAGAISTATPKEILMTTNQAAQTAAVALPADYMATPQAQTERLKAYMQASLLAMAAGEPPVDRSLFNPSPEPQSEDAKLKAYMTESILKMAAGGV
ncbi:MAG: signal peptide peptidase SppA [Nitrospirae bacterium]|nr:signal peptide peptidase SppA [Nitrospirota bacterium]